MSPSMGDGVRYGVGDYFLSWRRVTKGVARHHCWVPTSGRRVGRGEVRPAVRGRGSQRLTTPFQEQL